MTKTKLKIIPKTQTGLKTKPKLVRKFRRQLPKVLTGIVGLDLITHGGLPKGRPTLVCGGTGCGKTLLAMEFLVRGATQFDEPGVFMAFEESTKELVINAASLGFDLNTLIANKKIAVDFVFVEREEISESGEYNLDALFIRLDAAINAVGAKRVVLDTIESLFSSLPNPGILRAELRRLFRWLKDRGVTAVITGESGIDTISRQGLEEYISDCVIVLDDRINNQVSSRRLRIVKYRGSHHGTNEYPFLIDQDGISLSPITASRLNYTAVKDRVSSGIPALDDMLGGLGYFRGSSILVTGTAGTGKSSFLAHFADAACRRGEKVLFFSFEESPSQIIRNMSSIGIDLEKWVKKGLLKIESTRPSEYGLDMHLIMIEKVVAEHKPSIVVMDPVTSFTDNSNADEVKVILMKLVDYLKTAKITSMFSSLTPSGRPVEASAVAISSLIDSWVLLRDLESSGERNRGLYLLKSRGMNHSNQVREFLLTDTGVELCDVYSGPATNLTGAARLTMISETKAEEVLQQENIELKNFELETKRNILDSKILALRAEFSAQEAAALTAISQEKSRNSRALVDQTAMRKIRKIEINNKSSKVGKGSK